MPSSVQRAPDPYVSARAVEVLTAMTGLDGGAEVSTGPVDAVRFELRKVLDAVFSNRAIAERYQGAAIRYAGMCGEVARRVLEVLGQDPDQIGLLSIGDVDLAPEFRDMALEFIQRAHTLHGEILEEEGFGYDLTSQGSLRSRAALMNYFDTSYGFDAVSGLLETLTRNSTIVGGGMRGLDDIASAMVQWARQTGRPARFVHPDNSFGTWHAITNLRSNGGQSAEVHSLPTDATQLLHLTPEQVEAFYAGQPEVDFAHPPLDLWCITPVGNPSGTQIDDAQLQAACAAVVSNNPGAVILLDCTYVRTLPVEEARALMAGVLHDPLVRDRVVILESFSKTHGFCGERIGVYTSPNDEIFGRIQNLNMTLSAGNGRYRSALAEALATPTPVQAQKLRELHQFWGQERKGLYQYLIGSGNFDDIFEPDQPHILQDQLDEPLGLYVFLRLRPGVHTKDVLIKTGCLGVETTMGDGSTWMRFAVGKITKPTYSKLLDEAA